MKPTMSKDGKKRVNIRITYRFGAYDFENALCYHYREEDPDDLPADLSRTSILVAIKQQLAMNADAINWWVDDVEDPAVYREWARELVARKFPEFE